MEILSAIVQLLGGLALFLYGIEQFFCRFGVFEAGFEHAVRRIAQLIELEKRDDARKKEQQTQRDKAGQDFPFNSHIEFHGLYSLAE